MDIFRILIFLFCIGVLSYASAESAVDWAMEAHKGMILKHRLEKLRGQQ